MVLEKQTIKLEDVGNIFKEIAILLKNNINVTILINKNILDEVIINDIKYHVYFHSLKDRLDKRQWFTLHENYAFSPIISRMGVKFSNDNYYQVTSFIYKFLDVSYNSSNDKNLLEKSIVFEIE